MACMLAIQAKRQPHGHVPLSSPAHGGHALACAQGIAQLVKRPVSIVDRFRRVLGNGFFIGQSRAHRQFMCDDASGQTYLTDFYQPECLGELPNSVAKRMIAGGPDARVEHTVYPVQVGSLTLGQIIVWGSLVQPQPSTDLVAIEQGATVVALKMMEERSIRGVEQRFRNEILEGLLSDQPAAHERAIFLSRELGYRLQPPFCMILAEPDLPSGTLLAKARSIEQSGIDASLHLATRYLRAIAPESVFWYEGLRLVVFLPLPSHRVNAAKPWLVQQLSQVCQRVASENDPYTVSMGISSVTPDLTQFRRAYECARQSLQVGRALQANARSLITHYEDLGIFRFISLAEPSGSIERFCQDTLGGLLAYDRQNGTELVKTLRVFLEHNQNSAQAAKALHIHYNTLRYRLDSIREILGDALDHPQQRLAIEVALQISVLMAG